MKDHRINLPGGLGIGLNHTVIETAHRNLIWHPQHNPRPRSDMSSALSIRHARREHGETGTVINYDTLRPDESIQRIWLDQHTWDVPDEDMGEAEETKSAEDAQDLVARMVERLDRARDRTIRGISCALAASWP